MDAARFDLEAKAEGTFTEQELSSMFQALLAERFKFRAHFESRQLPVYALVLARPGQLGRTHSSYGQQQLHRRSFGRRTTVESQLAYSAGTLRRYPCLDGGWEKIGISALTMNTLRHSWAERRVARSSTVPA